MKIDITYQQAFKKASIGLRKKMQQSYEIITKALPLALKYDEKGFYCGFSGGKDSQALIHMMQLCDVPFEAYFSPTTVDPPEVIRFVRKYYPEVSFTKVTENIYDVFKKLKTLPSQKIRWCCAYFKERGGEGKVVCTGVRKAESVRRSKRNEIEVSGKKFSGHMDEFEAWQEKRIKRNLKNLNQDQFTDAKQSEVRCINGKDKILLNPIIEWTEQDVWEFLNHVVEVPHCELYDQGWTRIGCVCCPMAPIKSTIRDIKRWPHVKEKWIQAIMDVRKESILSGGGDLARQPRLQPTTSSQSRDYTPPIPKIRKSIHPNGNGSAEIQTGHSQTVNVVAGKVYPLGGGAKSIAKTTPKGQSVNTEYNEQAEREIAEAIFDWWRSKKSFDEWFAETYLQQKLDFDE